MKILVTTSVFPRWEGDSTPPFVLNLCRDLVERGMNITVLAPHSPGCPIIEKQGNLKIIRYPYLFPTSRQTLFYEGGMIIRLKQNRTRILQLPFACFAQYCALQWLLRDKLDIVHAHSLLPQGWIASLAETHNVPLVTSSHGSDVFQLKRRWQPFMNSAIKKSSALIANSNATANRLSELGARHAQIHIIPATPSYPDPNRPTHAPPESPTLLFAGRVIPEKGVDVLVEAMPEILRSFPDCTLRIAGSGTMETQLKKRVAELDIDGSVNFLGWIPSDQLRQEMKNATLLIAPSRVMEGQNLVVTEAMSVGCPVAVTPRGGMLDLVNDGVTGFVIPDATPNDIATALARYLRSSNLLSKVSHQGFVHFQTMFSRRRITQKTIQLYAEILRNGF